MRVLYETARARIHTIIHFDQYLEKLTGRRDDRWTDRFDGLIDASASASALSVSRHVDVDPRARVVVSHASNVESRGRARVRRTFRPSLLARRARSFAHEATQYALWIPFARARARGMRTLSYLFCTWFVLGELMLVYARAHRKVLARSVVARVGGHSASRRRRGPPTRETFGRFRGLRVLGSDCDGVCFRWCRNRSGGTCGYSVFVGVPSEESGAPGAVGGGDEDAVRTSSQGKAGTGRDG